MQDIGGGARRYKTKKGQMQANNSGGKLLKDPEIMHRRVRVHMHAHAHTHTYTTLFLL